MTGNDLGVLLSFLQGSDLECEVLPADDLATFCATWIKKASDAQGISASICAQLLAKLLHWIEANAPTISSIGV